MFKPLLTISTPTSRMSAAKPSTTSPSSSSPAPAAGADDSSKPKITDAPTELTAVVDDLLDSLSNKFATVSSEMFEKMDAMSKRLDAMEQALNNHGGGAAK